MGLTMLALTSGRIRGSQRIMNSFCPHQAKLTDLISLCYCILGCSLLSQAAVLTRMVFLISPGQPGLPIKGRKLQSIMFIVSPALSSSDKEEQSSLGDCLECLTFLTVQFDSIVQMLALLSL